MILPNWSVPNNVKAISSTRLGGFSGGEYRGLNLGTHVGDDLNAVQKNRRQLVELASMPSMPVWLNQTHSNVVVSLEQTTSLVIDADAAFTDQTGIVCSAMTADCLPVLLCNSQGSQVAAVHAGWRGLADGIVESALNHFQGDIIAWLGPAIGPTAFEVGSEVRDAFCDADPQAAFAFSALPQSGKFLANLALLAQFRLKRAGVETIFASEMCTFSDAKTFYSYRRDGITGRQASFIWLEPT